MICTFFGHRDCPDSIEERLTNLLTDLIERKNVKIFYVGNQGKFDGMVRRKLTALKNIHPDIDCSVVLAYLPDTRSANDPDHTIYPSGLETTPRKYAITKRNLWMIERSDIVITYVRNITGGAAMFREISKRKGKTVIDL